MPRTMTRREAARPQVNVRLVYNQRELNYSLADLGGIDPADQAALLTALGRQVEADLSRGYTVSQKDQNILVSPAPVFG